LEEVAPEKDREATRLVVPKRPYVEPEPVRTAADLLEIGFWSFSRSTQSFALSARGRELLDFDRMAPDELELIRREALFGERLHRIVEANPGQKLLIHGWTEYPKSPRMVGTLIPIPENAILPEPESPTPEPHPLLVEAMEHGPDSLLVLKAVRNELGEPVDFEVVEANSRGAQLLGCTREEAATRLIRQLMPSLEDDGTIQRYAEIMKLGESVESELHLTSGGFQRVWIKQRIVPLREGVAIFASDVTAPRIADETADRSRRMFERIAATTPDALMLWDVETRRLNYRNHQLAPLLDLGEEMAQLSTLQGRVDPEEAEALRKYLSELSVTGHNSVLELVVHAGAKHLLLRSSVFDRKSDGRPRTILSTVQDVTEQFLYRTELEARVRERDIARAELESKNRELVQLNEKLSQMARTDVTTGIKNRLAYQEKLEEEAERAQRYNSRLALLIADIDRFKQYNDTYGHPAGDQALTGFAQVLVEVCRKSDTVARYGGEEFVIILPNTGAQEAGLLGERIRRALATTVFGAQGLTASIGCAEYLPGKEGKERMVSEADQALYQSKNNGRDQVTVFGA
jgi:diguanylate cyclase (GGDEF)-like protein